ncbi:hypothetical protein [Bacillus yapensis]|nr:hypothetical protein [Bacillus yapensis]
MISDRKSMRKELATSYDAPNNYFYVKIGSRILTTTFTKTAFT